MPQPLAMCAPFLLAFARIINIISVDESKTLFKITTKRDSDKVEVKVEKGKTFFLIDSPSGISETAIERTGERWPNSVMIRLHLKGLERFRASSGKVSLNAAVSSNDSHQRLWMDDKEDLPLDAKSPFWMEIRVVGGNGKPANGIPSKDGYFETQLPKKFFAGNPKSITIKWIDFYRN